MSLFGANRVAAATTEMLVIGAIAGWAAGHYSNTTKASRVREEVVRGIQEKAMRPLRRGGGLHPTQLSKQLQVRAHEELGPIRSEAGIRGFLSFLDELSREQLPALEATYKGRRYNLQWIDALEMENMVQVLEVSARSALARTESRGVHYREDYPDTDNDSWLREIIMEHAEGGPVMSTRPVTITSLAPPRDVIPYLEMLKRMMESHSDIGGHH